MSKERAALALHESDKIKIKADLMFLSHHSRVNSTDIMLHT